MKPDQELQNVFYCTAVQNNIGKKIDKIYFSLQIN